MFREVLRNPTGATLQWRGQGILSYNDEDAHTLVSYICICMSRCMRAPLLRYLILLFDKNDGTHSISLILSRVRPTTYSESACFFFFFFATIKDPHSLIFCIISSLTLR